MTHGFVSDFGRLVIGYYLEFEIWDFNPAWFRAYAGLGGERKKG
jgi:hypothetical protein